MTQDDGGYDLKSGPPQDQSPTPKPGEPGWVPPTPIIEKAESAPAPEPADPDIEKNKGMAILAYICFIIPLLSAPNSKFARFHANQGLLSFIIWWVAIIGNVVLYFVDKLAAHVFDKITVLKAFFGCMIFLLQPGLLLAALALTVYGIIQAANGEKKPLPVIGQIVLIK